MPSATPEWRFALCGAPGALLITLFTSGERIRSYKIRLDEESVKAEYSNSENKNGHNHELHRVLVKIVIRLAIRKIAAHNSADKKGKEQDCE